MIDLYHILINAEVRAIGDDVEKAVFIIFNFFQDSDFSITSLCNALSISRHTLKNRLMSFFSGYTEHELTKPRYLAPIHEEKLAEAVINSEDKKESLSKDDVLQMV